MKPDLRIDQDDLKALYVWIGGAYSNMSYTNWCEDCAKSYMSYFNNKELFNYRKYTYSEWVNAQIIAIS
mgnify:FL=1|tara:strand:+ start:231 stop:437 length:207 start_codon:yes stop_codon:yes gene_type:complete